MNEMIRLIGKDPRDTNLLLITTAVNAVDIDRRGYFYNELERLKKVEFKIKEYDLVGKSQSDIENEVKKSDIVFVSGGQPFIFWMS